MRSGSFSRSGVSYGLPLSYVHPEDNKQPPQFVSELEDAALGLTLEQKQELQDRIDDLFATLRGERDYVP